MCHLRFKSIKQTLALTAAITLMLTSCKNNIGGNANNTSIKAVQTPLTKKVSEARTMQNYEDLAKLKFDHETGPLDGMTPGTGWSSDAEHIAPMECFSPLQVIRDGSMATMRAEYMSDTRRLSDFLDLSLSLKGGYGMFGTNNSFEYIKSLDANSLALSFTFSEKISRNVTMKYSPIVSKLLNQDGKDVYNDETAGPLFRLFCGDKLVSGYQEGAFVILSMQIVMNDIQQKQTLQAHLGANIGNFADLAAALKLYRAAYNLHGNIKISGFQLGGDPTQLSKALNTSIVSCDFDHIDECKNSMAGLINYVSNSLPNQFNTPSSYTPIGGLKTGWDLAEDLQMKIAPSYININVINARQQLADLATANRNNYSHLSAVINGYPIPLEPNYKARLINSNNIAYNNVLTLQEATDCWGMPNRCVKIKDTITSKLIPQPDKNILMGFPVGCSIYVPSIWNNYPFYAVFYSDKPSNGVTLKAADNTSMFYYPLDGNGSCTDYITGNAHDGGQSSPSVYAYAHVGMYYRLQWRNPKGGVSYYDAQVNLLNLENTNRLLS